MPKQTYLRRAKLLLRMAENTKEPTLGVRLSTLAADFFEKATEVSKENFATVAADHSPKEGER